MAHTYFFQTADWAACGVYYDAEGQTFPLSGAVQIEHSQSQWTLDGWLEVQSDPAVRFINRYEIAPSDSPDTLCWQSPNPAIGTLCGTFEIVGPCIVSACRSADGRYSAAETLRQVDADTYENVGVSFADGKRMSAWTARLTRTIK